MELAKEKILLRPKNIKPSSKKFEVLGVLNPGAARLKDKKIVLYVRVIERLKKFEDSRYFYSPIFVGKNRFKIKIDKFKKANAKSYDDIAIKFEDGTKRLSYISHLRRVFLDEKGFKVLKIDKKPFFYGTKEDSELGIEDARITKIGKKYYMTYVGLSRKGNISTSLAVSKDCMNWKRLGIIFGEQDKDVVLFPEKVNGKYVAFDRPEGDFEFTTPHLWIAFSKDLLYWGKLKPITVSEKENIFTRSGAGPPPIKTEKGWLLMFHAVTSKYQKNLFYGLKKALGLHVESYDFYAVWLGLFDLRKPNKLIARSEHPIIKPKKRYKSFEDKMVIFPTGIVQDGKSLLVYSGEGDMFVSVQKINLEDMMEKLKKV